MKEDPNTPDEFDFRVTGEGRVRIRWQGRHVLTLAGSRAARFIERAEGASDSERQLLMARVTGNFKRGNERAGQSKGKQ